MAHAFGRYELLRPVGRGGMAEIWLGRRRGAGPMERHVVVKRILRERVRDPLLMQLFVSESEISMAMAHKNIVPTFDFGRVGDELFLVMEYVDGTNFGSALSKAKKLDLAPDLPLVCHIIFEACQALDYAHRYRDHSGKDQCFAHRDMSPANLLLSFAGEVKLTDFGLASATADDSPDHTIPRGTPDYMAPEQFTGAQVGPSADLYSLGIILREAILGAKVRTGTAKDKRLSSKLPLPSMPDTVPEELRRICEKATSIDEAERFPDARGMAKALDSFLLHARIAESTHQNPMPERLAEWLLALFPQGNPSLSNAPGTKVTGTAITFLEHGPAMILESENSATMRSMEVTVANEQPATETLANQQPIEEEKAEEENSETDSFAPDNSEPDCSAPGNSEPDNPEPENSNSFEPDTSWYRRPFFFVSMGIVLVVSSVSYLLYPATPGAVGRNSVLLSIPQERESKDVRLPPLAISPDAGAAPDAQSEDPIVSKELTPPKQKDDIPAPKALLSLRISSTPWATVAVRGRKEGCKETPCQLSLPPGSYFLEFHNPIANLKSSARITLRQNQEPPAHIHSVLQATPD